jgi:hypothetical protein
MLEVHASAIASGDIAYHEFLLCYKAKDKIVYGIVEGREDPCIYRSIIDMMLPDGWRVSLIRAGNKKKVLKTFEAMDWSRFPKKRICFFVDRDLDEFLGKQQDISDNLYVTDKYSIECEIVSAYTFERTIEEIYGILGLDNSVRQRLGDVFQTNLSKFTQTMSPVMAQIILWRRQELRAHLNNIDPKEFFVFDEERLETKPQYGTRREIVNFAANAVKAPASKCEEILLMEKEFQEKSGEKYPIRGKYLLWYFVNMACQVHCLAAKFCSKYQSPPKANVSLGLANVVAVIGPRIRCPQTLKQFIERNYLDFIGKEFGAKFCGAS